MEDTNTVIKWILASVTMIAGILILQPYGLLFFGVACMIISFLIVNSIDDSKPIDWNKLSETLDRLKVNIKSEILIVEDDQSTRNLTKKILEKEFMRR